MALAHRPQAGAVDTGQTLIAMWKEVGSAPTSSASHGGLQAPLRQAHCSRREHPTQVSPPIETIKIDAWEVIGGANDWLSKLGLRAR